MPIKVVCPNGHSLLVKNEFAGKAGLCPHCKARILVPEAEPRPASEDDVLRVLRPGVAHRAPARNEPQSPAQREAKPEPAVTRRAPLPLRRTKVCPKCCEFVSMSHANCPQCQRALADWTFPLPQESVAESSGEAPTNILRLEKQGNVLVIHLGVNRILDELTIKKFGEELFRAVDQSGCKNFLVDFGGVVALCSAMLGVLLLLRRKIGQKAGSLKLCQIGAEIMDVFQVTKLGQLFEIHESQEQGLKTFT